MNIRALVRNWMNGKIMVHRAKSLMKIFSLSKIHGLYSYGSNLRILLGGQLAKLGIG
jgi:hypothetical protein